MRIETAAIAKCTLAELLREFPGLLGDINDVFHRTLPGLTYNIHKRPKFDEWQERLKTEEPKPNGVAFTHTELALTFMQLRWDAQDRLLTEIHKAVWKYREAVRLEVEVPWGKKSVRTMKVEWYRHDGMALGPYLDLTVSLM
ncbi:MAG: hypothetical protein JWL82_23 [Parcubacteria group bacterium]|nr:hypothetical protein [Parcubacteria group bacterium]